MKIWRQVLLFISGCTSCLHAQSPMIVAHRGASHDAPENTIPAFELAWKQGADAIEGDFHLTKDGHIVCIHDEDTHRVAGKKCIVKESTLQELRQLDVGHHRGAPFLGTVIPTFQEVLATVPPRKKIYIEVKCGAAIVPKLVEEMRRSPLKPEQMILISFHQDVVQAWKTAVPQQQAYWLLSYKANKPALMQQSANDILETMRKIRADGLSTNAAIPPQIVRSVQQQGLAWHVWTVDDPAVAQRMKAQGARSITTNQPAALLR
jgi:glycerophosphoryl diester phosphodiesterase